LLSVLAPFLWMGSRVFVVAVVERAADGDSLALGEGGEEIFCSWKDLGILKNRTAIAE
jgi:hypothetical protein